MKTAVPRSMPDPAADAETRRRELLAESDSMLDHVELLRLEGERRVPPLLRLRMRRLLTLMGRPEPAALERLSGFHNLLFAAQQRLMAGNPRRAATRRHAGRAAGTPIILAISTDARWKALVLPPPGDSESPDAFEAWLEHVDGTVERALDRWNYAVTHAVRCARDATRRHRAGRALALAAAAWDNYWELAQEAERLRRQAPGRDRVAA